jgi:hypothetical protein
VEHQAAVDCDAAKQDMLKANSEQEAAVAYQKMKALCSNRGAGSAQDAVNGGIE